VQREKGLNDLTMLMSVHTDTREDNNMVDHPENAIPTMKKKKLQKSMRRDMVVL